MSEINETNQPTEELQNLSFTPEELLALYNTLKFAYENVDHCDLEEVDFTVYNKIAVLVNMPTVEFSTEAPELEDPDEDNYYD